MSNTIQNWIRTVVVIASVLLAAFSFAFNDKYAEVKKTIDIRGKVCDIDHEKVLLMEQKLDGIDVVVKEIRQLLYQPVITPFVP